MKTGINSKIKIVALSINIKVYCVIFDKIDKEILCKVFGL